MGWNGREEFHQKTEVRIFERNNKLYVEVPGIEWIKPKVPITEVPIGDIYYI